MMYDFTDNLARTEPPAITIFDTRGPVIIGNYNCTSQSAYPPIIGTTGIFWIGFGLDELILHRLEYTWIDGVLTLATAATTLALPGDEVNSLVYDNVGNCLIYTYGATANLEMMIIDGITMMSVQIETFDNGHWRDTGSAIQFITDTHLGVTFIQPNNTDTNLRIFQRDVTNLKRWISPVDMLGLSNDTKRFQLVGNGLMLLMFNIPNKISHITKMRYVTRADNT